MSLCARERGSAGVWLLGLCSVLVLAAVAAALVGSALVTRHKAIAAADLSALAAAGQALQGQDSACAAAADIAGSMGALVTSCSLAGVIAEVTVTVTVELGVVGLSTARASARAGPVRYSRRGPLWPLRSTAQPMVTPPRMELGSPPPPPQRALLRESAATADARATQC